MAKPKKTTTAKNVVPMTAHPKFKKHVAHDGRTCSCHFSNGKPMPEWWRLLAHGRLVFDNVRLTEREEEGPRAS